MRAASAAAAPMLVKCSERAVLDLSCLNGAQDYSHSKALKSIVESDFVGVPRRRGDATYLFSLI
jgi:hypothetical protein